MTSAIRVAAAYGLAAALLLASPGVQAQRAAPGPQAGQQAYPSDLYYIATPDQLIRRGIDRLAGFLAAYPDAGPAIIEGFITREIAPYFDFSYMARWAAGPLYHRLSDAQRAALTAKLQGLFMAALARNLGSIERPLPQVDVFPARPGRTMSDAVVYSRVWGAGGQTRLEFRFYWTGFDWKVYDAAANGASAVAYYRRYFTTLLRQYGPDALLR
jgi:phospholipid transport system substrate-binding protein